MQRLVLLSALLAAIFSFSACMDGEDDCLKITWYYDKDGDGLGRPDSSVFQCLQPEHFVNNGFDGDDEPADPPINPRVPFIFTPGIQKAFYLHQTYAPYGFWFYAPPEYDSTARVKYPLLVHLHGLGERGNSAENPGGMNIILQNGAPKLIQNGQWSVNHPMIVVAPQTPNVWSANSLHSFISFLMDELLIEENRIYMTGLSFGANGTFNYVSETGADAFTAAIVPIAGWGDTSTGSQFRNTPVWAFHGELDNVVPVASSIDMINAINAEAPLIQAKLTIYPNVLHDSWKSTYDGTGMGDESENYDAFDMSIYDWMYQYQKND